MKIKFIFTGKTEKGEIKTLFDKYLQRINKINRIELIELQAVKKQSKQNKTEIKNKEAEIILKNINKNDKLVLLDEKGKQFRSIEFADFINSHFMSGHGYLVFVIAGAYGAGDKLWKRADTVLSMSKMTFSHQIIRLFFAEQLYRALSIIKNLPYHNE